MSGRWRSLDPGFRNPPKKALEDQTMNGPVEFYFQPINTILLVENFDGKIVGRAAEETFLGRKRNFIHELAMEGFIPYLNRAFRVGDAGLR